jgi:hypothetical protein
MGYLDNSSITVDAVLTKKGREILKNGASLNITSFTLSDTGVDYTLWNPDHPSGSAYYGEAIENLPMLEASVHAEYNLRNRLVSLNQNTVAIPALVLGNLDVSGGTTLTLKDADIGGGRNISVELVGYTSAGKVAGFQYYFVVQDPSLVSTNASLMKGLSGTSEMFLQQQDIPFAQQYGFNGKTFNLRPILQDTTGKQTNVYVVHTETGAYNSFTVINNAIKNPRAILSTVRSGG